MNVNSFIISILLFLFSQLSGQNTPNPTEPNTMPSTQLHQTDQNLKTFLVKTDMTKEEVEQLLKIHAKNKHKKGTVSEVGSMEGNNNNNSHNAHNHSSILLEEGQDEELTDLKQVENVENSGNVSLIKKDNELKKEEKIEKHNAETEAITNIQNVHDQMKMENKKAKAHEKEVKKQQKNEESTEKAAILLEKEGENEENAAKKEEKEAAKNEKKEQKKKEKEEKKNEKESGNVVNLLSQSSENALNQGSTNVVNKQEVSSGQCVLGLMFVVILCGLFVYRLRQKIKEKGGKNKVSYRERGLFSNCEYLLLNSEEREVIKQL